MIIGAEKAEKAADEEVNENGKHPGESGFQYYEG